MFCSEQPNMKTRIAEPAKQLSVCLTITPRLRTMSTKTVITWTLARSKLLDTMRIFKSDFSRKPGCQRKIWTLGTTTSPFQRSAHSFFEFRNYVFTKHSIREILSLSFEKKTVYLSSNFPIERSAIITPERIQWRHLLKRFRMQCVNIVY